MKNLATCKPSEFIRQTSRVKKSVEKWLKATDIMEIRKTLPAFDENMTKEERNAALKKQGKENFSKILDVIMDEHPDETLELLALLCFVEPEDIDNHEVSEYLESVSELMSSKAVVSFFSSLMQLGQIIS